MKKVIVCFLIFALGFLVRCRVETSLISYVTDRNGSAEIVFYSIESGNEWMGIERAGDESYPAFNEDQSKFLFLDDGEEKKIQVIQPLGQTRILSVPVSETATDPFWYPKGDFGYVDKDGIHRVTFAYGGDEIAFTTPYPPIRLFWTQDEQTLMASFLVDGKYQIGAYSLETQDYTSLIVSEAQLILSDYSENMGKLLYTEFSKEGNRIMAYDLETKEVTSLIDDEFRNESGIFDGEEGAIIFQSDRDHADTEIYNYEIYRWDGTFKKYDRLTENEAGDYFPVN